MLQVEAISQELKNSYNLIASPYNSSIDLDVYTLVECKPRRFTRKDKEGNPIEVDGFMYIYEGEKTGRKVSMHPHFLLTTATKLLVDDKPVYQASFSYDKDSQSFNIIEESIVTNDQLATA